MKDFFNATLLATVAGLVIITLFTMGLFIILIASVLAAF